MRIAVERKTTTNRLVLNRIERRELRCPHCPPHRGENATRQARSDYHKDHRRAA